MRDHANFGYHIRRGEGGWTWTTFDLAGRAEMRGHAPTKALAAACVIRALARASAPVAEAPRAAA
jgi:hypothetical protein